MNPFGRVRNREDTSRRDATQESLKHLKLNFPKYEEGKEVADWLQDCELYFEIYGVQEHKKVAIAGMHLEGVTRGWYQIFTMEKTDLSLPGLE